MEHFRREKRILESAQTHFLVADFAVTGVQAVLRFRTSCFPAAVGSAVAAAGLKLRLSRRRKDHLLAEAAAAAADFETDR